MRKLLRAELRHSWPAWLGVSIVFFTLSLVFGLSAMIMVSGFAAVSDGVMTLQASVEFTLTPITNFFLGGLVGIGVVSAAVRMVVDSRRASLARLSLSGATPGQVFRLVMGQLAVVTLVCALAADVMSVVALDPALAWLTMSRAESGEIVPKPEPVFDITLLIVVNLATVGFALLTGMSQARRASRIPPVEALREAESGQQKSGLVRPILGGVLGIVATAALFAILPGLYELRGKETASDVMLFAMAALLTTALALGALAPLYTGVLARAWTALIPIKSATWQIARRNISRRGARFARSVTPVMFTVAMMMGMTIIMPTIAATTRAAGHEEIVLASAGLVSVLTVIGPALTISLAGSVGSLLMMSKQRDAELALVGVLGATPQQRHLLPTLEALIIGITALFPALIAVGVEMLYFVVGLPAAGYRTVIGVPWEYFFGTFAVSMLITWAATYLPTLPTMRQPERQVMARLTAE